MRYFIVDDNKGGVVLIDNTKLGYQKQESYLVDQDTGIIKVIIKEFTEPIEAIHEYTKMTNDLIRKEIKYIREEIRNRGRY